MLKNNITIRTTDPKKFGLEIKKMLKGFQFNSLRPMSETLKVRNSPYTICGRNLYIDNLIGGFPTIGDVRENREFLCNLITPLARVSRKEAQMTYDLKISLDRKLIRSLPIHIQEDRLHPYGYTSEDLGYLYTLDYGDVPKCQADALEMGRISLNNLINYGAYDDTEWIIDNWGADEPEEISIFEDPEYIKYEFETEATIFPLLYYIVDLFQSKNIKVKITYKFSLDGSAVKMVKPYDSYYFTEV